MANPKKILFWPDVYKEQGHWLPTLAWADYLNFVQDANQNKSFDIKYMGIADCHEIINNAHIWVLAYAGFNDDELKRFRLSEKILSDSKAINTTYNSYVAGE